MHFLLMHFLYFSKIKLVQLIGRLITIQLTDNVGSWALDVYHTLLSFYFIHIYTYFLIVFYFLNIIILHVYFFFSTFSLIYIPVRPPASVALRGCCRTRGHAHLPTGKY